MTGDFSRFTFDPRKQYSRVLMQQGRVQLDSDWNEQVDISAHAIRALAADLIGSAGGPGTDGFRIADWSAVSFDGSGARFEREYTRQLSFTDREPFTIASWIHPTGAATSAQPLVGTLDSNQQGGYLLQLEADGRISFHRVEIDSTETVTVAEEEFQVGDVEIVLINIAAIEGRRLRRHSIYTHHRVSGRRFTHVVAAFHAGEMRIYVDGTLAASSRRCLPMAAGTGPFYVGGLAGYQGETCIWSRVLDEHEIAHEGRRTRTERTEALAARYAFSETEGTQAGDSGPHDYDLTFVPSATLPEPRWVSDFWIRGGRYYCEGTLCENHQDVLSSKQAFLPALQLPESATDGDQSRYLVYLDVWERIIGALEAPSIKEVALGGPDTAVRAQTIWQVKTLKVPAAFETHEEPSTLHAWKNLRSETRSKGAMKAARVTHEHSIGNLLYRVQIHSGGIGRADKVGNGPSGGVEVESINLEKSSVQLKKWNTDEEAWAPGDVLDLWSTDAVLTEHSTYSVTAVEESSRTLTLDRAPEISSVDFARARRVPTILWSRDNACVAFAVSTVDASSREIQVVVDNPPSSFPLKIGDWIELINDDAVFLGQSLPLSQILEVDDIQSIVTVGTLPQSFDASPAKHPLLRKWDESASNNATGVIPLRTGKWIDIEHGIQIWFAGGRYHSGDYWTIPARTITGDIEWPSQEGEPEFLPPHGVYHALTPLALVESRNGRPHVVRDYHKTFEPLTTVTTHEGDFVRRSGDTMTGSLTVKESVYVAHQLHAGTIRSEGAIHAETDAHIRGTVRSKLYDGALVRGIVGTDQIRDRAVTVEKIDFSIDPGERSGYALFPSRDPVLGYVDTGSYIIVSRHEGQSAFRNGHQIDSEPISAIGYGNAIFVFSDTGRIWRIDPDTNETEPCSPFPNPRGGFAIASTGGKIYVLGGVGKKRRPVSLVDGYDPEADLWFSAAPMPTPRSHLAAIGLDLGIHAIGGYTSRWYNTASRTHESYDPETDQWIAREKLPWRAVGLAAVQCRGRVWAAGGKRDILGGLLGMRTSAAVAEYDAAANVWHKKHPMLQSRSGMALNELGKHLYVFGGETLKLGGLIRESIHRTDEYAPEFNSWTMAPQLQYPGRNSATATLGNTVYAVVRRRKAGEFTLRCDPLASIYFLFAPVE